MVGGGSDNRIAGPHRDILPTDGVPIRSAATLMLIDDRPDLHVLSLRRTDASTFVAGHTLFPGGAVDKGDCDPRWAGLATGAAGGLLGMDDPSSYRIAAVRETIEEIGIRAREAFLADAPEGASLELVPSLNASSLWVDAVVRLLSGSGDQGVAVSAAR